jgi:hypothetical protein
MDLHFNPFEIVAVGVAVVIANPIALDGRSNWLEGALLLSTYAILGLLSTFSRFSSICSGIIENRSLSLVILPAIATSRS